MSPILTFDHSQRSSWQMCKRSHFFRHGLGIRKATPDSAGFSFGSAFHASSETLDITGDINAAMAQFTDMFSYPDDKVRTLVRARELLVAYQEYVAKKHWTFTQTSPTTMEIAFNEVLVPDRINYAGRCDRQFEGEELGEYKTTYYLYNKAGNAIPFLQGWWGHNSIRGYAWARKAKAMTLLGIGVYPQKDDKKNKYRCIESLRIPIQNWEIALFIREATKIGEEMISYYQKFDLKLGYDFEENMEKALRHNLWNEFDTNTTASHYHTNDCQFNDLCTRNVPKGLVESNYVLDPFLPWVDDEKGEESGK